MIPDDSRKKLEQLRQQAMARSALMAQYKAEMTGKYTKDMPPFSQWLAQRNMPKMAGGGSRRILPKERREANLAKFQEGTATPRVMYHATSKDFNVFDRLASTKFRRPSMDTVGSWFSSSPEKAERYAGGEGYNVMPAHLNVKNPKLYAKFDDFLRDMHEAEGRDFSQQNPKGIGSAEGLRAKLKAQGYDGIQFEQTNNASLFNEMLATQEAIKNARLDERSVKRAERAPFTMKRERLEKTLESMNKEFHQMGGSTEFDGHDVFVAFDPEQIKSAIGNRGTYDPNKADSTKAGGGPVNMARGGQPPKATVKAYKLFRVDPNQPGKLFPLFVDANTPVEMGKWVDATEGAMANGKVKSKIGPLAYRPGWHAGDLPIATHIGEKSDPSLTAPDTRPANHAWAEVEMPDDVDWQSIANERGTNPQGKLVPVKAHITDQIPKGGHYRYKTNPNMTGNWLIGGSMKVNRVLTDAEVAKINRAAGLADLPRAQPFKKKAFGFARGGAVGPEEWMAEEHVNHMADGGEPDPMPIQPVRPAKSLSMDAMKLALTKNNLGMHSPLEKSLINVPRTKGTAQEFMTEASKQPGFRKEELEDRPILMPEGKLTKEEFVKHVQKNRGKSILVDVRRSNLEDEGRIIDETHHGDWVLPGGENYREVLLKQPQWSRFSEDKLMGYEAQLRRAENPTTRAMLERDIQQLRQQKAKVGEVFPGVAAHFNGEPGIIASLRLKDRVGPNGEKILHIEEIQSDWHQEGRKKGYQAQGGTLTQQENDRLTALSLKDPDQTTPEEHKELMGLMARMPLSQSEMIANKSKVPDAPHKKSWHELALKHALTEAVEGGYHGIAITPGQAQADRYDLSKKMHSLIYVKNDDGTYLLQGNLDSRGGESHQFGDQIKPADLENYVGKEIAQKIQQGVGVSSDNGSIKGKPVGSLSGLDLKVGGEGMKGFYDKILPDFLNKLGKKHDTQVQPGTISIKTTPAQHYGITEDQFDDAPYDMQSRMRSEHAYATQGAKQDVPVHYFSITPSLRQQIKTEGLPQYHAGGMIHKADGGAIQGTKMNPTTAQMRASLLKKPLDVRTVGVEEAIGLSPKLFLSPDVGTPRGTLPPPGGVATPSGMPIGGVDMSMQPGQQLMPQAMQQQPQQPGMQPQGGLPAQTQTAPDQPSNILQMTPQGQAMSAIRPPMAPQPTPKMAKGGTPPKSVEEMKNELAASKERGARITIHAQGSGGVKGIIVPRHTLEGNAKVGAVGLHEMNDARSQVYGSHHRDPLTINKMGLLHKGVLQGHFDKPVEEQVKAEEEATNRLRQAKHLGRTADTLDESEKLDTVRHEHDEEGRTHVGYASKGVAGHALYTTGSGKDTKYQVINTCPGQTEGCGGGKDAQGVVDTMKGTCFAPNAESQYPSAAVRRAAHEQAKHDPEMSSDWILAHTGSLRNAAGRADKKNQRLLFRPNVVDETDVSSRHVIRHLNEQRKADGKPPIIANSYGKTNELHDPENGYYVTHSNVGPKVKKGQEVSENIGRDKARVRNTIMAADNKGDFKNEQGNLTPPKGSYMVTDVKRGSPLSSKMKESIKHAKYWSAGRSQNELSEQEKEEGPEGHFSGAGRKTTEDKAHYGHRTIDGVRYDYQRQHILHPRLVQVGQKKDGSPNMIPTDSRFKDTEFLPKDRFKTKNGKEAGHILMTTPTESTSSIGHQTSFTHHVNEEHVKHALANNGEYEIDRPEDQIKAKGKEYQAPQAIKFYAEGGSTHEGRHPGLSHDSFHAFPEQNYAAMRHLAMRHGEEESKMPKGMQLKKGAKVSKNLDTMRLALTKKAK
jgi:hypothetical protein